MSERGCLCDRCTPAPEGVHNRPGLPAISYRLGSHSSFLRTLLARLPFFEVTDDSGGRKRPLADLTTRERDDPSIALLDAWATVADVLTFYQERIANEGYLRTSTERRSILELVRTIGYELAPGLAAGTYLAFTIEDAPGAPGRAEIVPRIKVQSIPGQGEKPQTFETVETIEARAEWNAMIPRRTRPQRIEHGLTSLLLAGIDTRLERGDAILLVGDERIESVGSERWDVRILDEVEEDFDNNRTRVTWSQPLGSDSPNVAPAERNLRVYTFRRRAALFGHNAPDFRAMPLDIKKAYDPDHPDTLDRRRTQWPNFTIAPGDDPEVDLDAAYPKIAVGSWVVLVKPSYTELYRVVQARLASRTDFTLTSKTTRLNFDTREHLSFFGLRDTVVLAESEELALAEEPIPEALMDDRILLPGTVAALEAGRPVIVSGRPFGSEADAEIVTEVGFVESMTPNGDDTMLELASPLEHTYEISSVSIAGNVVRATHGETTEEILGGGRGDTPNQTFALRKPPLTHVSAQSASGAQSTLTVRVNGVEWRQSGSFFGLGAGDQNYIVRTDDDGITKVIFGDGRSGSRLPTGTENVAAVYRAGLGMEGNLPPERISLLLMRPLGVRSVTNPVPSESGTDPDSRDDARRTAPTTVLTLGRVVSLRDYEDFAQSFAGVGKALATALWEGDRRLVHLTITGVQGAPISPTSDLFLSLSAALENARDRAERVAMANYEARSFGLAARVLVDPRYVTEDVLAKVHQTIVDEFSFERRDFGQSVTGAEVVAVIQRVEGVVATDLDQLYVTEDPERAGTLDELLPSRGARVEAGTILPAQLRLVDAGSISLVEMTP